MAKYLHHKLRRGPIFAGRGAINAGMAPAPVSEFRLHELAELIGHRARLAPPVVVVVEANPHMKRVVVAVVGPQHGRVAALMGHESRGPEHAQVVLHGHLRLVYLAHDVEIVLAHHPHQAVLHRGVEKHAELRGILANVVDQLNSFSQINIVLNDGVLTVE